MAETRADAPAILKWGGAAMFVAAALALAGCGRRDMVQFATPLPTAGAKARGRGSDKPFAVTMGGGLAENAAETEKEKFHKARSRLSENAKPGSAVRALATGQFKGKSVPEPDAEVTAAGLEAIPAAPDRRPVTGPEDARARVLEELASDSAHLRFVAAHDAGRLRVEEAVPLLARLARRGGPARLPAIFALGRVGGGPAAKALEKALRWETDAKVRSLGIRALGATRARAALRQLRRELLGGKMMFQMEAAGALGALGLREAVPALRDALGRTEFLTTVRVAAAAALAALGDPAGAAALERAATEPSPVLQLLALRGLANLARAPASLVESASLRARAVRSVAAAVGSQYEEVWSEAVKLVVALRPQGAVAVLDALERGAPDVARRARVARAAWGEPGAEETLVAALQGPNHLLRAAACGILGSLGAVSATGALTRALSDPSESVRVSAVWALAAIGGEEAARALERASASDDVRLRNAAREAAGRLRPRQPLAPRQPLSARPRPAVPGLPRDRDREAAGEEPRARRALEPEGRREREGGPKKGAAGLVLERVAVGTDGTLFCSIRAAGGEPRLLRRGEEAGDGYRVEVIVPSSRGGGKVVLSRDEGREAVELTVELTVGSPGPGE